MARAFVYGDNIDTDLLAPGAYMKSSPEELARHCLEAIDPDFASSVQSGDLLVAGANFGMGSSREQAAVSLKMLGVSAVLAQSFARIFFRNAINLGVPAVVFEQASEISPGDQLEIRLQDGAVDNLTTGKTYEIEPLPSHIMAMIRDGGLLPHLKRRVTAPESDDE
jgi:3-isopropylmalate/(R)-2-methylmalate dehydratase small subunit